MKTTLAGMKRTSKLNRRERETFERPREQNEAAVLQIQGIPRAKRRTKPIVTKIKKITGTSLREDKQGSG